MAIYSRAFRNTDKRERRRRQRELKFEGPDTRSITRAYHAGIAENNVDPDDGNSWVCSACNLPIFSTPYTTTDTDHDDGSSKVLFVHDQCADLPKELKGSVLHPREPLFLKDNHLLPTQTSTTHHCVKCNAICGTKFYYCRDPKCGFQLDLLCALPSMIKIVHRSHEHRLMAIRAGSASFICGACGTQHQALPDLSYLCSPFGFWIHPHCASLPNVILLHHAINHHHQYPLVLTYRLPDSIDPASSKRDQDTCHCAICKGLIENLGVYSCIECRDYYVHIMCAVSDPQSFTPDAAQLDE